MVTAAIDYYARPTPMTAVSSAPSGAVPGLLSVAREVIVHEHMTALYGFDRPAGRNEELMMRPAAAIVDAAGGLDARPSEQRVLGNCRQFSVLTVALLRANDIAARARCGFSSTFEPGRWVDHWIVEWHDGSRWVRSDCQIDDVQRATFGHDFDPLDLPDGAFATGGEAWDMCRNGTDPETFGILDMWGLWFVQGNAVADLAALNKVEMLPWDDWGLRSGPEDGGTPGVVRDRMDEVADVCAADDLAAVQDLYRSPDLKVPGAVRSWYVGGGRIDDVGDLVAP